MGFKNNSNVTVKSGGGIGFFGILGIVFIVLKLMGIINWSWVWVLAPFWVGALLAVLFYVIVYFVIKKIYE